MPGTDRFARLAGFMGVVVFLGIQLGGCAASSLKRLGEPAEIPAEMAQDLAHFEVKEESAVGSSPSVSASPTPVAAASARVAQPQSQQSQRAEKKQIKNKAGFAYPNRRPPSEPIYLGERVSYDITYLGMTAGEFSVSVEPFKEINNRKVYHIKGSAKSSKVFSMFYKLDDTIESFIDYEGIFPHRFQILLDESKQKRNSLELFDSEKGRTFFWNRWDHHKRGYTEVKDFFPMQAFSQDSLSSLYFLRTVPLPTGSVTTFPVISEGKNWEAVVTVVRREEINTPMGRLKTIVLKPETKYQGILKKQGDSFIWLTDDERRFMVRLEAKVKIGSIVAKLKSIEPGIAPQPVKSADESLPPTMTKTGAGSQR